MTTTVGLILLGVLVCLIASIVGQLLVEGLFLGLVHVLKRIWRDFQDVLGRIRGIRS